MRGEVVFFEQVKKMAGFTEGAKPKLDQPLPNEKVLCANLQNTGNPWGMHWGYRESWAKKLNVPTLEEANSADLLFWVGCAGAFDQAKRKQTIAVAKSLKKAGISFAILGNEEQCCGGTCQSCNQELFQALVSENVEAMNFYQVKTVLTHCSKCFHMLKNVYPEFGGHYRVINYASSWQER